MQKKSLKEFWNEADTATRNKILLEMSEMCKNSIETVRSWMLQTRNPKGLYRDVLFTYLKDNFQVEITKEGGER